MALFAVISDSSIRLYERKSLLWQKELDSDQKRKKLSFASAQENTNFIFLLNLLHSKHLKGLKTLIIFNWLEAISCALKRSNFLNMLKQEALQLSTSLKIAMTKLRQWSMRIRKFQSLGEIIHDKNTITYMALSGWGLARYYDKWMTLYHALFMQA